MFLKTNIEKSLGSNSEQFVLHFMSKKAQVFTKLSLKGCPFQSTLQQGLTAHFLQVDSVAINVSPFFKSNNLVILHSSRSPRANREYVVFMMRTFNPILHSNDEKVQGNLCLLMQCLLKTEPVRTFFFFRKDS